MSPTDPQQYYLRGLCRHNTNQFQESAQDCHHSLLLWEKATHSATPSFFTPPPQLFITYGSSLFQLDRFEDSAAQYAAALRTIRNPQLPSSSSETSPAPLVELQAEALFGMGRSLLFCGKDDEAMLLLAEAVNIFPPTTVKLEILMQQLSQLQVSG